MSIASQCSECCTCPTAEWTYWPLTQIVCASKESTETAEQCGLSAYEDASYDPLDLTTWDFYGRKFATLTRSGANGFYTERIGGPGAGIDTVLKVCYGGTYTFSGCTATDATSWAQGSENDTAPVTSWAALDCSRVGPIIPSGLPLFPFLYGTESNNPDGTTLTTTPESPFISADFIVTFYSSVSFSLSDEVTADDAIGGVAHTEGDSCCAYTAVGSTFTGPLGTSGGLSPNTLAAGSRSVTFTVNVLGSPSTAYNLNVVFTNFDNANAPLPETGTLVEVTTDVDGIAEFVGEVPMPQPGYRRCVSGITSDSYVVRFPEPTAGMKCLRVEWIERTISEDGVALTGLEIIRRGVYRPGVSISGGGGSGAIAVAIMGTSGNVTGIRVLNPGSGYTSAPSVDVGVAINGGTSSTGWTASLAAGGVSSISGGSGGDYLPTISFTGGGGVDAEASCTMDETGGLASVTLDVAGSDYVGEPDIEIQEKVSYFSAAYVLVHIGTETARCAEFGGTLPEGYSSESPITWPYVGPYAFPAGGSIAHIRTHCDCSSCP